MSTAYDWSEFTIHSYYRAPIERVFAAWSTAAGLTSFFIGSARHSDATGKERAPEATAQAGDAYEWGFLHGFELTGTFLDCVPNERVAFTFGGPMQVEVSLREVHDQIEVQLRQTGCGVEDPDRAWQHLNCRSCWVYFMTNLKSVLEHGVDVRDHESPALNDAVSIGFAPVA